VGGVGRGTDPEVPPTTMIFLPTSLSVSFPIVKESLGNSPCI
jgi:hypothetical protein